MTAPAEARYTDNPVARSNRAEKARQLAAWAYQHGWLPEDLPLAARDPQIRRWAERTAVGRPCSDSTWAAAVETLAERLAWDAAHPDDPRVRTR